MATATLEKILFEKVSATIGARVEGIALDEKPTLEVMKVLREGLHEHGVLFFEFGVTVEAEEFARFSEMFGEVEPVYGFSTKDEAISAVKPGESCIDARLQP